MPTQALRALILSCLLSGASLVPQALAQPAGQAQLSPAQTAYLKAETRRIEDRFVADVARITATTPAQVRRAMPDERRITVAASRLISALEMELGNALTPEQQAAILGADQARKEALAQARAAAARH